MYVFMNPNFCSNSCTLFYTVAGKQLTGLILSTQGRMWLICTVHSFDVCKICNFLVDQILSLNNCCLVAVRDTCFKQCGHGILHKFRCSRVIWINRGFKKRQHRWNGNAIRSGKAKRFTAHDWQETGWHSVFRPSMSGAHFMLSENVSLRFCFLCCVNVK